MVEGATVRIMIDLSPHYTSYCHYINISSQEKLLITQTRTLSGQSLISGIIITVMTPVTASSSLGSPAWQEVEMCYCLMLKGFFLSIIPVSWLSSTAE